jgi:predicted transposase YdaD
MSKPFDATLKNLARERPGDYLTAFDAPPALPVRVLNVDLSTVTTASDLVLGLGEPLHEAIHFEFHASAAEDQHRDTLAYNVLLYRRLKVPVHSLVLLLRPQARHPNDTGAVRYAARPGRGKMEFEYEVIRLWERPADELLAGPLGTLPLAPLGKLPQGRSLEAGLTRVIARLAERLQREAAPAQATRLLTSAYILTGLRTEPRVAEQLFRGARAMRESTTYQAILEEGRVEGRAEGRAEALRQTLLRQGQKRFGKPSKAVRKAVLALQDVSRLEELTERLLDVASWKELLG